MMTLPIVEARRRVPAKFHGVRPAASLIEVFVVLAIIALLTGILMPAVLRARESASYITCRHHLRQIGFAIHQYEVAYGYFPGVGTSPHQDSVLTRILPYLEQTNLQQSIATDKPLFIDVGDYCWIHVSQQEPARTVIPLLICPSESQAPLFADRNSEYGQATLAGTNYNFNAGTGTGTYYDFRYPTDGLFWYGSKIRHKDITDGLSSTMFVSEALMGTGVDVYTPAAADTRRHWMSMACTAVPDPDHPGTIPPLTDELCAKSIATMTWRGDRNTSWIGGPGYRTLFNTYLMPNEPMSDCGIFGLGRYKASSAHPGGVNMILGDGSVHFIKNHIELATWRALSTRGDCEALGSYCGCH